MTLIEKSRTESTGLLARTLASLNQKPEVFLVASAIGWYGNRGDEILDEILFVLYVLSSKFKFFIMSFNKLLESCES